MKTKTIYLGTVNRLVVECLHDVRQVNTVQCSVYSYVSMDGDVLEGKVSDGEIGLVHGSVVHGGRVNSIDILG